MKRVLFIVSLFLIFAMLILGVLLRSSQKLQVQQPVPTPTPVVPPGVIKKINYENILPDPETRQAVVSTLQSPSGYSQNGTTNIISFSTNVADRPNQVFEQNNIALYVQQEITGDNTSFANFASTHPNDLSFQMFDTKQTGSGFSWYVYPQDGIAYLANKDSGYTIQILYFKSTTQDDFINTVAKQFNMSLSNPDADTGREDFQENP